MRSWDSAGITTCALEPGCCFGEHTGFSSSSGINLSGMKIEYYDIYIATIGL